MKQTTWHNFSWGIDRTEDGINVNILDPDSKDLTILPFPFESFAALVKQGAPHLSEEQRREIVREWTGGIILPDQPTIGDAHPDAGPQG